MKTYQLEIITPEHTFFSGEVHAVTVLTPDGQRCLMAGHLPIILPLEMGKVKVRSPKGVRMAVSTGGFLEMLGDKCTLLLQAVEWLDDIDVSRAEAAFDRAKRQLQTAANQYEQKQHLWAFRRAQARLKALESEYNDLKARSQQFTENPEAKQKANKRDE